MVTLAAQGMSDGLGQMGAAHSRPGMPGTPGFYLQLSFWNQSVAERNAEYVANAGDMDPISGALNMFNPVSALATAVHNVEVGSRVHGHDRGNLIEAQGVNWLDKVLPALGKAIDKSVGTVFWGQSPIGEVVGEFLAAGIDVNAQTGDYGFAMNERAWMEFATEASATIASHGWDSPAASATQTALQVANAGMQYDGAGRIKGWKVGEITTADIGGAVVTAAASQFTVSEKQMHYSSDFSTVLGQEYGRAARNAIVNAAAGWANQQIGSKNRLVQQFGVSAGMMAFSSAEALWDSFADSDGPDTRASTEQSQSNQANQNDQNRRAASMFQGWQFSRGRDGADASFDFDLDLVRLPERLDIPDWIPDLFNGLGEKRPLSDYLKGLIPRILRQGDSQGARLLEWVLSQLGRGASALIGLLNGIRNGLGDRQFDAPSLRADPDQRDRNRTPHPYVDPEPWDPDFLPDMRWLPENRFVDGAFREATWFLRNTLIQAAKGKEVFDEDPKTYRTGTLKKNETIRGVLIRTLLAERGRKPTEAEIAQRMAAVKKLNPRVNLNEVGVGQPIRFPMGEVRPPKNARPIKYSDYTAILDKHERTEAFLKVLDRRKDYINRVADSRGISADAIRLILYYEFETNHAKGIAENLPIVSPEWRRQIRGRGTGWGQFHDLTIKHLHPKASKKDLEVMRNDFDTMVVEIANVLSVGAGRYLEESNGRIDITGDVYMLAYLYNTGPYSDHVIGSAERRGRMARSGERILFDLSQGNQPMVQWLYHRNHRLKSSTSNSPGDGYGVIYPAAP